MSANKSITLSLIVLVCGVVMLAILDAAGMLAGIVDIPSSTYIVLLLASGLVSVLLAMTGSSDNKSV